MDKRRRRSVFNWLYMLVRRDFWRKLIALFFALLLYFYVYNEIRAPQKVDNVPVDIMLPPELMDFRRSQSASLPHEYRCYGS